MRVELSNENYLQVFINTQRSATI